MQRQRVYMVESPLEELKVCSPGSLWAETQKYDECSRVPDFDISELETLFSIESSDSDIVTEKKSKDGKVLLIDPRRAYGCEIMLSKVNTPVHEIMDYVLAMDDSKMDVDQIDNLIKFCPTKDEMEQIKQYNGDKDDLAKCERFFFELMRVPRSEAKLRVFSFKLQFYSYISDVKTSLENISLSVEQIRSSVKLRRVMQTVLSLGNALNQGTPRGAALGFRLDSLLKLNDTRGWNNNMTLMHYLCKVIAVKQPELLDLSNELSSLKPASKIRLKFVADDMQEITRELERVILEKKSCKKDGQVSNRFRKCLKKFLASAEIEVKNMAEIEVKNMAAKYLEVGKTVDALIFYFGEVPARYPYEKVISTLLSFVRMFKRAHADNCKIIEAEKKKAQKEAVETKS